MIILMIPVAAALAGDIDVDVDVDGGLPKESQKNTVRKLILNLLWTPSKKIVLQRRKGIYKATL